MSTAHGLSPLFGLSLLLGGCGDNAAGPVDPGPGPDAAPTVDGATGWTVTSFCAAQAEAICEGLDTCGCRFDIRPYDAAGCVAARAADCAAPFGPIADALDAGLLAFADAEVTACLAGYAAVVASCRYPVGYSAELDACQRALVAATPLGETCGLEGTGPCAEGAGLCLPPEGGGAGACTALPGLAEPCPEGRCVGGLVCNFDEPRVCVAPGLATVACFDDPACAPGLTCRPDGVCGAPGGIDAPCFDRNDCAAGLACPAGTCAAGTAAGEACGDPDACGAGRGCGRAPENRICAAPGSVDDPCQDGTCGAGLACQQSTSTCRPLPVVTEACLDGFACAPGLYCDGATTTCAVLPGEGATCADGQRRCAAGLGCRDSDQTCRPASIATLGEPCLPDGVDYLCAAGLGCDFAPAGSICIAVGGVGDACTTDRVCGAGTYCEFSDGVCAAKRAPGQPCEDGNECAAGAECAPQPAGFTCTTIPAAGQPCFNECASGSTCQGLGGACTAELCVFP